MVKTLYETQLKLPEAVASHLSTYLYENFIVNKFVLKSSQIQKELNVVSLSIQYRAHDQLQLSIREKCTIYIIATNTGSAIRPCVFSNKPLASPSKRLNSIGCYLATCPLKHQKSTVRFS